MSCAVSDTDEIVVMTAAGVVMRTRVSEIRIIGRGTKGVRIMRLDENDKVVGVAIVQPEPETTGESAPDVPGTPPAAP
jgi:DNA gyrase subunit A